MKYHELRIAIPYAAAGTSSTVRHKVTLPGKFYIKAGYFMPDVNVAAHADNFSAYALTNTTDTATLHTWSTDSDVDGALTGGTAKDITADGSNLLAQGSEREIVEGDVLTATKTDSGTGAAGGGSYVLLLEYRPLP